jgi:hypothetical protein
VRHYVGPDKTLWHPCFGVDILPSTETLNFNCEISLLINFIRRVEITNSGQFYSKPVCHVVSEAFSIFKNTVAVDILLLKFTVT